MHWLPEFMKTASNGNGLLLVMSTDEFFEITMYVVIPLWFLSSAWHFFASTTTSTAAPFGVN